jgi:hypothetical protein
MYHFESEASPDGSAAVWQAEQPEPSGRMSQAPHHSPSSTIASPLPQLSRPGSG